MRGCWRRAHWAYPQGCLVAPGPGVWGHDSAQAFTSEPRLILLDAKARVITGKVSLNHGSVVGPAIGVDTVRTTTPSPVDGRPMTKLFASSFSPHCHPYVGRPSWIPQPAPQASSSSMARAAANAHHRAGERGLRNARNRQRWSKAAGIRDSRAQDQRDGLDHAEGSEDPVSGKHGDRHTCPSLEMPLEQDEAFAGVAPALARWAQWLERVSFWAPIRKPSGVREHVAYRDVAKDGLIEILDEAQRQACR